MPDGTPGEGGRRRRAVALDYDRASDLAPRVTAAGSGATAERIIAAAREAGVPIREDPDLVETLALLDMGAVVPPDLYGVIAEVLAWAYRTNAEFRRARSDT